MSRQGQTGLLPFLLLLLIASSLQQGQWPNSTSCQTASSNSSSSTVTNSSSSTVTNSSSSTVTNSSSSVIITNCSSSVVVTNSSSSNSSGQSNNNSSSSGNTTYTYGWFSYTYYKADLRWSFTEWISYFIEVQSRIAVGSKWNYGEWYSYALSQGEFHCNAQSFINVESAIVMTLNEAWTLAPNERKDYCVSLKASLSLASTILKECEEQQADWDSFSTISVLQYTTSIRISNYKTIHRLLCSENGDSNNDGDSQDADSEEDEQTCDRIRIRDNLLAFLRLELSWNSDETGCSDASLAVDAVQIAQESCPWELRSSLSLITSHMHSYWTTMCTPPTCNIQYADISLSSALMVLEEIDDNNSSHTQSVTEGVCKSLKLVLATATNHTVDCLPNIYNSMSRKFEQVQTEYVKRCGALPQRPKTCVIAKPDVNKLTWSLGTSFFFDRTAVCLAAKSYSVTNNEVGYYCNKDGYYPSLSCLANNCSSNTSTCENSNSSVIDQLLNAQNCLTADGISTFTVQKLKSFLSYIQAYIRGGVSACNVQRQFDQLVYNATISILSGETESSFCLQAQFEINNWFASCGTDKLDKNNITAAFSLVCPKSVQLPGCNLSAIQECFGPVSLSLSDKEHIQNQNQCMLKAVTNCPGAIASEALNTVKNIAAFGTLPSTTNDSSPCICDPAAAVNCIMDVHHQAKQITPDWEGLCPKVPESETCARSYIEGCEECKKSTVLEIVYKLNSQLEEICIDPPVTECSALSAMQCVTDLSHFQESSTGFGSDTICIKILVARNCVYQNTEKCDAQTTLSITNNLEYVISKWKDLKCQPPEDMLENCSIIFETRVYAVLGMDMNTLWSALQRNDSTLQKKLTDVCEEVDFSWQCMNASLSLQGNKIDAVIVKKILEALYKLVTKVCKSSDKPLQCYSCEGNGQNSCANGHTVETCNNTEICETTTSIIQGVSTVKERGCSSRTACKAGCDKYGCTYCCSGNLCNNLDNGPIEEACSLTAVAGCALSLSKEYVKTKDFQCSSVNAAVGCIKKEHEQCEIGGAVAAVDSFMQLNLSADINLCLIEEANQTCELVSYITYCGYISQASNFQFDSDGLCGIIAESRNRVSQAKQVCKTDEYLAIQETQTSLEATVGHLNCEKLNFTIDVLCKPIEALLCVKTVLGVTEIKGNLTCQVFTQIVTCMKEQLVECTSDAQILLVNIKIEWLKTFLPANANCADVKLIDQPDVTMTPVAICCNQFSFGLKAKPIAGFFEVIMELHSCLMSLSNETYKSLTVTEQLKLEMISQFIVEIVDIYIKSSLHLEVEVSQTCNSSLSAVVYKHGTSLINLPFLSLDQRAGACSELETDITNITSNCDLNATADIFTLLDNLREHSLVGFCPEIKAIPRCLISRAEECYTRFSVSFGLGSKADMCKEASNFVDCAVNYTASCDNQEVLTFRQKAAIAVDFIIQACPSKPDLLAKARCKLLGRVDVQPGCTPASVSGCSKLPKSKCSEIESTAACYIKNAGKCVTNIPGPAVTESLNKISECRFGDNSHSSDTSILTTACSSQPYTCDGKKAKDCLVSLSNEKNITAGIAKAKQCLENNYYCFASVMSLINQDITSFAILVVRVLEFTPGWTRLESRVLIKLLTISSYINGFLDENKFVNLRLWDMCWLLDGIFSKIETISITYPSEIIPYVVTSMKNIKFTISDVCNNLGDVAQELELPQGGKENSACPVTQIDAQVNILFSRIISEFYTSLSLTGDSVCTLYINLVKSLEADVNTNLSLMSCSSGFSLRVRFALKIALSLLGNRCEVPDYDIKRCDVHIVEQCVDTLFKNIGYLGKNQTVPGLCMIFEETKACVEKYSFKCQKCALSYIEWIYSSVKKSAEQKCMTLTPTGCEKDEQEANECNIGRATKCSINPLQNIFNLFITPEAKCRHLLEDLNCIQQATGKCTTALPKLLSQGADKVKTVLSGLGCKDNTVNMSSSCRDGCWITKAYKCIEMFKSEVTERMWSSEQKTTCRYINELRMCVAQNITTCHNKESDAVSQALDTVLEKFQSQKVTCIDMNQCSQEFDDLVQQIINLKPEDESGTNEDNDDDDDDDSDEDYDDDDDSDEDHDDDDTADKPSSNVPSLNALYVRIQKSWANLKIGLQMLPDEKRSILVPLYNQIWASVEEKCSNTRQLECYYCSNKNSPKDCEAVTEICPNNKGICMFSQALTNSGVTYSAGCTSSKKCQKSTTDEQIYYCSNALCNKKTNFVNSCELDSDRTCKLDISLKCALNFSTHYFMSDSISCSDATYNLGCIQKNAYGCSNSKSLTEVVSKIFFSIASSTCVINSQSSACYSLTINSLETILSSAYVSEGNSVCVALKETTASVNKLISSETCTEEGKVNLKVVLHFISSIIGNYCADNKCPKRELSDGSDEEVSQCSGHIFDGIINIYKAYTEKAKSDMDCGTCADNALSARQYLHSCNISPFVTNALDALDSDLTNKCQIPAVSTLPEVCSGLCQSAVVLNFTKQVSTAISVNTKMTRWYLSKVQEIYISYTSGCTSVQQRDVVNYVTLTLGSHIEECKKTYTDFTFELVLKKDIYYSAMECSSKFQEEMQAAFFNNDQQAACQAIAKMKTCDLNIPDLIYDMINGIPKGILDSFEKQGICGDIGNDKNRKRRDTSVCQLDRLSEVISILILPSNIATAVIDCRNELCQKLELTVQLADKLVIECSNELSTFQLTFYNTVKLNVQVHTEKFCPPVIIEKCDIAAMAVCRKEYNTLSGYALSDLDALCGRAKYALVCSLQNSVNCTSSDNATAFAIQATTKAVIKQSLGNSCPLLTPFFYCSGPVNTVTPACQWDEAQMCRKNLNFDFTRTDDAKYCQALRDNVTCVQKAASGCEAQQITSLNWPGTARNGMCSIADITLNNVCQSVPVCSTKPILECFAQVDVASCQSLQVSVACMTKYLNSNKQCQLSLGHAVVQYYLSIYYSTLAQKCGVIFSFSIPMPYVSACVDKLVNAVNVALKYRKSNTGTEIFYYMYSTLSTCLTGASMEYSPVIEVLQDIVRLTTISSGVKLIEYNIEKDITYTDTDTCFFSLARACLGAQIIRTFAFKELTVDEKNEFCDNWKGKSVDVCITSSLSGCAQGDRELFLQISTLLFKVIDNLAVCEKPKVCMVSETNGCFNKLYTVLANYERDNDTEAVCLGQEKAENCLEDYLFNCTDDKAKPIKDSFKPLSDKAKKICNGTVLSPVCPDIQERNRVCVLGNAFLCLANFNFRLLGTSDSLIWRQQCLDIQKMMVCIATNTTSCDPKNSDVKIIIDSLEDFKELADYQCPWLTDDFCSIEPPCPVMTAGCDVELERKLINRVNTVCKAKEEADQCVANNTATCTKAQTKQAVNVINKKMVSLGLPKDLNCQADSSDGCVYSFLSAARDSYLNSSRQDTCKLLASQYSCIVGSFSNQNNSSYLTLAKTLIDRLYTILNTSQCAAKPGTCTTTVPVKKLNILIIQLALNSQYSTTSFCAKSQALLLEKKANDCNAALYNAITESDAYKSQCSNEITTCNDASTKIQECIKKIGVFSALTCADKQKAAICVTDNLPANCNYNSSWLNGNLCDDTIVLQMSGNQGKRNYISESGLTLSVAFKYVAGSKLFKLKMIAQSANASNVPSCLEGSQVNNPIAQVYTGMNPQSLVNDSTEINFIIYAIQDYRTDGPQIVNVTFMIIPLVQTINATSGQKVETELTDKTFALSVLTVNVEDCDQPHSVCSAINDPHIITFDNIKYNNMGIGPYILYRHIKIAAAVIVYFNQCAPYGTCTCGVTVFASDSSVTFSICKKDTDFVTYNSASGAATLNKQQIAVFVEKDLNKYHVLIKSTGTIVTVVVADSYLQTYVKASPLDFGNIQGLCANYDGDGYNDFEMPDNSVYKLSVNDTQFGILTPNPFNDAWKISSADASNVKKIYAAGVVSSTAEVSKYCFTWSDGKNVTTDCSDRAHLATCGFIGGEDQTSKLLGLMKQDISTSAKRRRKRQAVLDDELVSKPVLQNSGWPTSTGWTERQATDYCMDKLFTKTLVACRTAMYSIDTDKIQEEDDFVKLCVDDIRISGTPDYTPGISQALTQECINKLNQNPVYQSNSNSSDLALAFSDTTCIPFDCNGHGKCIRGQCFCDSDYVGTNCNTSIFGMTPPLLWSPEDGAYLCEIGHESDCEAVFISGRDFVSSSLLSCHIREVEITTTGIKNLTDGTVTIVKAEMIAANQIRCDLGGKSSIKRSLAVSISNDGKLAYERYQTFIAFDPTCYDCDLYSCTRKEDVCIIGNKCLQEGETSVYSDCQYCNLENPNDWSIRLDNPECRHLIPVEKPDNEKDNQTLVTALIAVGCSLGVLLVILIVVCVIRKRRQAKRRHERAVRNGFDNANYHGDMPFNGQPIRAFNSRQLTNSDLLPPKYE